MKKNELFRSNRSSATRMTALIAVVSVCAIAAFGCNASGASSSASGASSSASGAAELTEVTVMLDWTPNTNHTGMYVAMDKGYYEEAGLKVNIIEASEDGAEVATANGSADFGISFQDYLVPAFSATDDNKIPVTAVAAIIQHNTSGIISLKESGIEKAGDMAGHSYATWDLPIEQAMIAKIMKDDGADFADVNLISTSVYDIVAALNTDIDSVWIYYAWDGVKTELEGLETNFFYFSDYGEELDNYSPVIIANNKLIEEDPETVEAFVKATQKGYEYAIANPEESAKILVKLNEGLDEEICIASQNWLATRYQADADKWGVFDQERWDAFYTWVYENGLCEYEIPAGFGFTNEFID